MTSMTTTGLGNPPQRATNAPVATSSRGLPGGKPCVGGEQRQAELGVLASGVLRHRPRIKEFEAAFARFPGAPHAVGVAPCTAGLHPAYFQRGIGPGDEVIVPAMTHTA